MYVYIEMYAFKNITYIDREIIVNVYVESLDSTQGNKLKANSHLSSGKVKASCLNNNYVFSGQYHIINI